MWLALAAFIIFILVVGLVLFQLLKQCEPEDKGLAGGLTGACLALCAAAVAWTLAQEQIRTAQRQSAIGLATYLETRLETVEDLQNRVNKIFVDLLKVASNVDPRAFGLDGPPEDVKRDKYLDMKAGLNALWQENDRIRDAAAKLQSEPAKTLVSQFVAKIDEVKTIADLQVRIMDAMLADGPQGGRPPGATLYDPKRFGAMSQTRLERIADISAHLLPDVRTALSAARKSMSDRLNGLNVE